MITLDFLITNERMKKVLLLIVLFSNSLLSETKIDRIDKNCYSIIEIQKIPSKNSPFTRLNLSCKKNKRCLNKLNEVLPILNSSDFIYELGADDESRNYYSSSYLTIICNKFGFISVGIYTDGYDGGMHPYHYSETYVAHISQNKLLTLVDLVYPTPEFWDLLSREVSKSINSPNAEIPKKEDFKVFTLSDTHLEFTFNEYVIGDYVSGAFSGSIPISRIQKFLKPEIKKIYNLN